MINLHKFKSLLLLLILCCFFVPAFAQSGENLGDLIVMSNFKGASIYINGKLTEQKTPAFFTGLQAGDYLITLVESFGKRLEEKVTLSAGKTNRIQMDFLVGNLKISSNIEVDSVFINGVLTDQVIEPNSPALFKKLVEGDCTIRLIESQYGTSKIDKIFLLAGEDSITMNFKRGNLNIISNKEGALVSLNGRLTEQKTPASFKNLPVGIYEILLEKGNRKATTAIRVKAAENLAEVNFEKGKKWTYIGLAAVAVVTGGLTYFLTREKKESEEPAIPTIPILPDN